jgi:hypothetical protein
MRSDYCKEANVDYAGGSKGMKGVSLATKHHLEAKEVSLEEMQRLVPD